MLSTPRAAVDAHLVAMNSGDVDDLIASTTFPLFQGGEHGEKSWYETPEEVPFPLPPSRAELVSAETVAALDDLVIYLLTARVFDPDGGLVTEGKLMWTVHQLDGEWKVGWRQFLGSA